MVSVKSTSLWLAAGVAVALLSGCGMTAEERAKMDDAVRQSEMAKQESAKARMEAEQCRKESAQSAEKSKRAFEHGLKKR